MIAKDKLRERYERIKSYINSQESGEGCILLDNYEEFESRKTEGRTKPTHTKLRIWCPCGNEFERTFANFTRGTKACPQCSLVRKAKEKTKTHETFVSEVKETLGEEYEVLSQYINSREKVVLKHNIDKCGHIFEKTPINILSNLQGCPECSKQRKSHEEYVQEVYNKYGDGYSVIGEFVGVDTKVLVQHNSEKCNNYQWKANPNNFPRSSGCPKCQSSKGESDIEEHLIYHNLTYTTQQKLDGCRDKRALKFDFAIYNEGELFCLIEYDGEYHYKRTRHRNSKELLNGQQRRDKIKNDYCQEHNIKLIRIPYWERDNISEILDEELKDLLE